MNTYTRSLMLAALTAVSLTQGCSCSDNNSGSQVVIDPPVITDPVPEVATINGSAAKGLIFGGIVSIHPIINGVLSVEPVSTTKTDDSGSYSVTYSNYDGSPFVVRVTTDESTTMMCDLAMGCEGVAFGETLPFNDPDFTLDAVLPTQTTEQVLTNVSVLTDIAAERVFDALQVGSTDETTMLINNANASVANRFGLFGGLTTLPIVDLTNSAALVGVNDESMRFNLLNASIIQAVLNDGVQTTISAAMNSFAQSYTLNGLTDNAQTTTVTSLADILAQASNTLTLMQNRATANNITLELANLTTVLENLTNLALAQEPTDEGTQGGTTPTTSGDEQAKAKAFVGVLGDLSNSMDLAVLTDDVAVGAQADAFDTQIQAADMASSDDLEQVVEATAVAIEAMAMAYDAYDSDMTLTSWESDEGVMVTIVPMTAPMTDPMMATDSATQEPKMHVSLTVEQNVSVEVGGMTTMVAIDMTAMEDVTHTESTNEDGADMDTAMGHVGISGTASVAGLMLTVKDGSMFSVEELMSVYEEDASGETASFKVSGLELELMADVAQQVSATVTDPITFSGMLKVTLESLMASGTLTDMGGEDSGTASQEITKLALALWGRVTNTSGDSAAVSFSVKGDGTGIDFSQSWLGEFSDADDTDSESDSEFTAAHLMLSFNADLAGVSDAVMASLNMRRSAEQASVMSLKFSYPGVQMQLATTIYEDSDEPQKLVITNQDGVVATFIDGDEVTGTIFVGAKKVADVKGVVVTYIDGSFGSLDLFE
ncbi:hypothetical protein [Marinagarivorans algicola]|uniref:hypothetical protein n=1 Tax=Marinagarivorans algicola TaxID=1513270 RepID=UPI0012E2368E|nr:hypothetical protein [Marinagarivorans algicola]